MKNSRMFGKWLAFFGSLYGICVPVFVTFQILQGGDFCALYGIWVPNFVVPLVNKGVVAFFYGE